MKQGTKQAIRIQKRVRIFQSMLFSVDKDNVEATCVLQAHWLRQGPRQMPAEPRFLAGESAMCWKEDTAPALAQRTYPLSTLSAGQGDTASEDASPRSEPGKAPPMARKWESPGWNLLPKLRYEPENLDPTYNLSCKTTTTTHRIFKFTN